MRTFDMVMIVMGLLNAFIAATNAHYGLAWFAGAGFFSCGWSAAYLAGRWMGDIA